MKKNRKTIIIISMGILLSLAKLVSLISKIFMNRRLGLEAMSIFSLCNSLIVLILTLSSFSLQTTISSLISRSPQKKAKIFISSAFIAIIISILLIILLLLINEKIAIHFLHNKDTLPCIRAITLLIPLHSFSAIIKGYYIGLNKMTLASSSTLFEEIGRLLFIVIFTSIFASLPSYSLASIGVYSLCVGELFQGFSMLILGKENYIKRVPKVINEFFNKANYELKEIFTTSLSLTSAKLIGSITYFFEAIIFTTLLSKNGYSTSFITIQYGLFSSYVLPLLMIPSFFSTSVSTYLLPKINMKIRQKKEDEAKRMIKKVILISLIVGAFFSLIFFLFPKEISFFLFKESKGAPLVKVFSLPFILYYIESPLICCMQAYKKTNKALISTCVSSSFRIIFLLIFTNSLKVYSLGIATISSIYIDVILNLFFLKDILFFNDKKII